MNRTHLLAAAAVFGLASLMSPLSVSAQDNAVDSIVIVEGRPAPLPVPVKPVPEPAAIALFAAGLGVTALAIRRLGRR